MVTADEAYRRLSTAAPQLVSRLDDYPVLPFDEPDVYTIAYHILSQYSLSGTTTFTQSDMQSQIGWTATAETARRRFEILAAVGFITIDDSGRESQYRLAEPVDRWTALSESTKTDLPVAVSPGSVVTVQSGSDTSGREGLWSLPMSRLPEPTPERLATYQHEWQGWTLPCFIIMVVSLNWGTDIGVLLAVLASFVGLVLYSLASATFVVRQLQGVRGCVGI
jgi:hypothetical protein